MTRTIITTSQIAETVAQFTRGAFVGITFRKADGTLRKALAQFGVSCPSHVAAPNGRGESAKQAMNAGRLKFFDANAENADGTRGGYRQAQFDRILDISTAGRLYIVDHTSAARI